MQTWLISGELGDYATPHTRPAISHILSVVSVFDEEA